MEVLRLIKGGCSIRLYAAILSIAVLSSTSSASPYDVCGEWRSINELQGRSINDILVHASTLFAATDAGVYKSEDGFAWRLTTLRLSAYTLSQFQGGLLAGTQDGVYLSPDKGATWRLLGLKGKRVTALAASGSVIYAGTDDGVYRMVSEGVWEVTSLSGSVKSLAADPTNPNRVFAGTGSGVLQGDLGDLYFSADGGASWSRLWFSNTTFLTLLAAGFPLYYEVTSITFNPCNASEVYAGTFFIYTILAVLPRKAGALHVSRDYGSSWESMGPGLNCVFDISVSEDCRILTLGTDNGVYISDDGGRSWHHLGPANETVTAVGSYGARVYAGTSSGLLAFHRIIYPTKMSLKVEPTWIPLAGGEVRLSGNLTSLEKGLPFKSLKILFNGVKIGSCRTNAFGGYDCTIRWPEARAETVNLTLLYPGDPCYEATRASRMFHLVNVTTAYGSAMGAGWYEEGSRATIRVVETVVREGFTEYIFKGWRIQGAIVSSEPTLTITVEKPVKVEAVWEQRLTALAIAIIVVAVASLLLAVMLIAKEKRGKSSSVRA
ncbi:MAG: hypothetical protein QXJ38_04775 [Thermofilaceae archaeon]